MEFGILGPLEVAEDGAPVPLGGQKQRAVLALLVLEAGRVVPTDRLVQALWGESPPRTAATSLQNFISQLRKVLGPDVLVTKPPGYVLRIRPEQIDLNRFRRLVDESRAEPAESRATRLAEALRLWRGPPLADFTYESFAQSEIGRLDELRLAVEEERLEAELEAGRHADVVGELESLAAFYPLRERLHAQLMTALYHCGRQADALRVYREARTVLINELGIEPGPALQQLHGAILRQEVSSAAVGAAAPPVEHFTEVARALLAGRLVAVLGSDVGELAADLARRFGYPHEPRDLARVSQYVSVMKGSGPLYDELHALLEEPAAPSAVHRFFASLPPTLRSNGVPHQLIVTTSYDLALEQAFLDAGEEFDVVSYIASGRDRGKFCHVGPDGRGAVIDVPNTYAQELSLERRTIILKLHGQVDRTPERAWESFVVTEDDYIDYLPHAELANSVPVGLAAKLRRSHFLFLGYTMADWNLRLVLNRLWGDTALSYRSWAVQPEPKPLEQVYWRRRDVDVLELPLEQYVNGLGERAGIGSEVAA